MFNIKETHGYTILAKPVVWTTLFFFCALFASFAQQNNKYFFRVITQEDGLLQNNVYDIAQDRTGFIWIATANALQRYDGNRFLNFGDVLADPSQSFSGIPSLYADNKNYSLWISKSRNSEKIDLTTKHLTFYTNAELLKTPSIRTEKYLDKDNIPYLLSDKIIFIYDTIIKKFNSCSFNYRSAVNAAGTDFVTDLATGETWLGSNANGLILLDKKTKKVYTFAYNPIHNPVLEAFNKEFHIKHTAIRKIMLDSHHNLWVATWGKLFYQYNVAAHALIKYSLSSVLQKTANIKNDNSPLTVSSFYEDNHRVVWIATENAGLLRYNNTANDFDFIPLNNWGRREEAFTFDTYCIFQDREENIWLGTDKGIRIFNPYRQYFQSVQHEENSELSLPKNEIECFLQTRSGDILVGTWGGGITIYDSVWQFKKTIRFTGHPELNLVWSFIENDDGTVWAGCQHGYIHIYDPASQSIRTIHPAQLDNYTIRCMAKDSAGNIWFGLHNGKIAEWSQQEQRFHPFNESVGKQQYLLGPVRNIFFDADQRCWAGTENGLRQFDTKNRTFIAAYAPDKNNPNAISAGAIKGLENYNDSTLVIGTLYGGLNLFNTVTKKFSRAVLKENLALPENIHAIKKDATGNFWFTADYELFRFNPTDKKIVQYNMGRGVINSAFKSPVFYALHNGRWMTCTSTEIISFHPGTIANEMHDTSKVAIAGFRVFDALIPVDSLLEASQPIRLGYKQNFITVEFAKLGFSTLHQYNYYYRLTGLSKDWVNSGTRPFATYTNLQPGTYTFEVKSDDGAIVTPVTSFSIIITPPFWKTWWFTAIIVFCLAFIVYTFINWRIGNIKAVEAEKLKLQAAKIEMLSMNEKLSMAKLEALRSQMNPHFIFNCLASIDNLIQKGDREKATTYLARFARLIRSVLETSKSNAIPCWKDMETLAIYLEMEELRCDKKFRYKVTMTDDIINGDYKVPPLIIQPFVENAIHHGLLNKIERDKELLITVSASANYIHYTIQDNGVGRTKAAAYQQLNNPDHQSMGLQITTDRINLYNKNGNGAITITDLYDDCQQPAGTKVQVNIINQP